MLQYVCLLIILTLVLGDYVEVLGVASVLQHLTEDDAVLVVAKVSSVNQVNFIADLKNIRCLMHMFSKWN